MLHEKTLSFAWEPLLACVGPSQGALGVRLRGHPQQGEHGVLHAPVPFVHVVRVHLEVLVPGLDLLHAGAQGPAGGGDGNTDLCVFFMVVGAFR